MVSMSTPLDSAGRGRRTKSRENWTDPEHDKDSGLAQHFSPRHTQGATNNFSSSIESQSGTWPTSEATEQETVLPALRAVPDFARVYNFLGSIFDPETSGHLQRLREMDPIDVETVLLLMKNLSLNLSSPNVEAHRAASRRS